MKNRSLKKTLGTIGTFLIWTISAYVIYKVPEQVGNVLWPLIVYNAALFGIKKFGANFSHNNNDYNDHEEGEK